MTKRVLLILTSHAQLGSTGRLTGVYLPELAHSYEVFEQAGYEINIASPLGGSAPIDPKSLSDELELFTDLAEDTLPLSEIDAGDYDAFFVVGGHGTMWDLSENADLQRILPQAYAQNRVIAAVCHGPAALVNLKDANGQFLIRGKKVTGFTNEEESAVKLTEVVPFLIEDKLKQAGGQFIGKPKWQENIVIDENLVTGQNPASTRGVAEAVTKQLQLQTAIA